MKGVDFVLETKTNQITYAEMQRGKVFLHESSDFESQHLVLAQRSPDDAIKDIVSVRKNKYILKPGWHDLGYPYYLGLFCNKLVLIQSEVKGVNLCVLVDTGENECQYIFTEAKTLDALNLWHYLNGRNLKNLFLSVNKAVQLMNKLIKDEN